jgi:hypothetical protein
MASSDDRIYARFSGRGWIREGLIFGLFMYILMTFVATPLGGDSITLRSVLLGIPIWLAGGLGYGISLKWWFGRRKNKKS